MTQPPHMTSKSRGTYSDDHGTPDWILDLVRRTVGINGHIDIDLASSAEHQERVRARFRYFSKGDPYELRKIYGVDEYGCDRHYRSIFCNPPGPKAMVHWFWAEWDRLAHKGAFVMFNLDHLHGLNPVQPGDLLVALGRVKYHGAKAKAPMPSGLILRGCDPSWIPELRGVGSVFRWL